MKIFLEIYIMNTNKYFGEKTKLEQAFKILIQRVVPTDENRGSLQQFNDIVENSWKLTIDKYKETRASNCLSQVDYKKKELLNCGYKLNSKFAGENSYIDDRLTTGCFWKTSTGNRVPLIDLSKY